MMDVDVVDDNAQAVMHEPVGDQPGNDTRLWRMLSTPMVTIRVGPSQRSFYINHELLCHYSLFFRDKLRNTPDHGHGGVIILDDEDDDETSFAVFAEWLFLGEDCDTGKILEDTLDASENGGPPDKTTDRKTMTTMRRKAMGVMAHNRYDFSLQFRCYRLAHKLQAPGFKNQIMEEIQYHGEFCDHELPTMDQLRFVHDRFGRDDPLWRFCVNLKRWDERFREAFGDAGSI